MNNKRQGPVALSTLLQGEQVRRVNVNDQTWYAAVDAVALLAETDRPEALWDDLKLREPQLGDLVQAVDFPQLERRPQARDALSLAGLFRLVQAIPSPRAQRLKSWLAQAAADHLREAENPELLALRARKLYEQRGYSPRWVDKRLRGISARHELTGEWYRRGATASDDFRKLTNELMQSAFGMDVEGYRRYKNLSGGTQNLRDHMSDLELALTTLAETAAVALHQARNSQALPSLETDVSDAGQIIAQTRQEIERRSGLPVINPQRHLPAASRRRVRSAAELADKAGDMHNSTPPHQVRTVA